MATKTISLRIDEHLYEQFAEFSNEVSITGFGFVLGIRRQYRKRAAPAISTSQSESPQVTLVKELLTMT